MDRPTGDGEARGAGAVEDGRQSGGAASGLKAHPLVVVVPSVRSAYNVGSIFRTADSAGLRHVYLCGFTPTPEHRGVAKTALGAQDAVPWSQEADVLPLLARLKGAGYAVAALEITPEAVAPEAITEAEVPLALVLGNEVHGVAPEVLEASDCHLALPQYGTKASLNVSVAFGVAAYALVGRMRALGAAG
ncbi:MAG: TrmH family RNA methyltransferase [Bacteroidota bacterium]